MGEGIGQARFCRPAEGGSAAPIIGAMLWDLFCRVIDNFGDAGVCWRLAAELAGRGQAVRLWIDDATPLAWMAPGGAPGVQVLAWTDPAPDLPPGDVVIEAFGCTLPDCFVAGMAARSARSATCGCAPVWINLEHLSAETYVERSHGLPSPQFSGPGAGLQKWFFFPGFTGATGGLLQAGAGVAELAATASAQAWAQARGWAGRPGERVVTLFCYANPALPALLAALANRPTLLRVPPGPVRAQLAGLALPTGLRAVELPCLPQADFDRLLASADLNIVRGEDSFVRAQLCSRQPMLWQAYPQHDQAHLAKLEAFLARYLAGWPAALAAATRRAFLGFNQAIGGDFTLPDAQPWAAGHARWRQRLLAQPSLCDQLQTFVAAKQSPQASPKPG